MSRIGPRVVLLGFGLMALLAPLVGHAQDEPLPDRVEVRHQNLFPEGIEFDGERFLLGSLSQGSVYAVSDSGVTSELVQDADLMASTGIQVDAERERLLVANADPGAFNPLNLNPGASLGIYNLETGERLHLVDLRDLVPGRHFPNDVAVDDEGNAYVTDSFAAAIYRVTPEGEASLFAQDARFTGGFLSLNGIVYHPDGYLLVAQAGKGALYKVPLDDPEAVSEVTMIEPITGADGMVLKPDGTLVVVSGSLSTVFALTSEDGWETAVISGRFITEEPATTAAVRDNEVYVIYARMRAFNFGQQVDTFPIVRVEFEE